jgi:hemoglobin/transferrin/lactoferrin receptor protein
MACRAVQSRNQDNKNKRQKVGLLLGTTVLTMIAGVGYSTAQTAATTGEQSAARSDLRNFNIPAQSLRLALLEFNRQSGIQVSQASGNVPTGITTNAVSGRLTPQDALERMLSGTGVEYSFINRDSAIIGVSAVQTSNTGDGSTVLSPIVITGKTGRGAATGSGFQGTPDWVYQQPSSVSVVSRQAIQNSPVRNTRDLLDNTAGVYVNRSEGQNPGISVNVRGLQDQNRVVSMIDGARQNFQRNGHASSERTYIDNAFIREIDIEKAGTSGVGGAASLGGSVNFRTVGADDIISEGRQWGFETNVGTGTNAFDFDGSAIGAFRFSDNFAVTAGVSRKKVGAYDIGDNGELTLYSSSYRDGAVVSTGQNVVSTIFKAEASIADDLDLTLGWIRNDSEFSHGSYNADGNLVENLQDVLNNTLTSHLHWDPASELVDLNFRLWYNRTKNDELRTPTVNNSVWYPVDYRMGTIGVSLDNTSTVETSVGRLSLNYGVEAFWDRAKTEASQSFFRDGNDFTASYTGMTPSGNRDVYSAFANATLEPTDWLTVSGGLRYDYYKLHGSASIFTSVRTIETSCALYHPAIPTLCLAPVTNVVTTYPETVIDVDRSDSAFLPTAMVAVKPFDWLQPFVKYSRSMRPPTVMETFVSGGHPSANVTDYAPNADLRAETGDTFEIGANITHDGLLSADDSLRLKVVGFYREIEDYISLGTTYRPETSAIYGTSVNIDGTTRMKGVELEATYDAGSWYAGLSYTHLKTDFGDTYSFGGATYEVEPSVIFIPPRNKVTIDGGVRFFEENLVLGGRANIVGGTSPNTGVLVTNYVTEDYTTYDIYGSYAFTENVKLRFAVNNLTDVAYIPALGAGGLPAPGRTATASLSFKF